MTPQRREIVKRLQQEGYDAYQAGKSRDSCPYRYMDALQWLKGWNDAYRQANQDD